MFILNIGLNLLHDQTIGSTKLRNIQWFSQFLKLVSNAMKVFISKLMKAVPLEEYFAVFIEEKTNFHVL